MLSVVYAECCYAECHVFIVVCAESRQAKCYAECCIFITVVSNIQHNIILCLSFCSYAEDYSMIRSIILLNAGAPPQLNPKFPT